MPPIPIFDSPELLGALEIGAFVSIFLFGTVVMQGHLYYQSCKTDSKWLIAFVSCDKYCLEYLADWELLLG